MKNILWPPPPFFVVVIVVVENHERLSSRDIGWKLIMKIRMINPDDKTILRLHHEFIEPLSHPMKNPGYSNANDHVHDVLSESFIFYNLYFLSFSTTRSKWYSVFRVNKQLHDERCKCTCIHIITYQDLTTQSSCSSKHLLCSLLSLRVFSK
jgi:hypothetical protein